MELLKYIAKYVRCISRRLTLGIFLLIISTVLSIMNPILIGRYIDVLTEGCDIRAIVQSVMTLVALWVISMVISYVNSINSSHMNTRLMYDINFHLLRHVERLPYAVLAKMDTVYLNNRIHNDSSVLSSFFLGSFLSAIVQLITCLIVAGVILITAPLVGILVLLLLPLYLLIYAHFRKKIEQSSKVMMEHRDVFFGEMQKQLRHVRTIKLNSWYDRLYASLIKEFTPVYEALIKNAKVNSIYSSFTQAIQISANIIIFLVCGIAVSSGSMKLGSLITINSLFSILFSSFSSLMDFGKAYAGARAAFSRVKDLEMQEEEKNGDLLPENICKIQMKDLSFQYTSNDRLILNRVSLEFETGKVYQIRGENGCGKSTLINLLMGLYETQGQVCFDEVPVDMLDMFSIRKKDVAIVEQEPPLVFGTVSENIAGENFDASDVLERLSEAGLDSFTGNLNLSETRALFEGATNLSGGEKQKVAVLRALLKNPHVLILDEPASALDAQSCKWLKDILKEMKQNRIIILVDHQSTFSDIVDINYTLYDGKIL